MFKKITVLCLLTVFVSSCLNDNEHNLTHELLPIDEAIVPASFIFGQKDTIAIKYTLKNSCYHFDNLYYEYQDTSRVVAVSAFVSLEDACAEIISQKEYKFAVNVTQQEDYVFKFWKGTDSNGENIFEEIIVSVD
jgi:nitrate/TMAO reductase-like tetraheme cytochrome c subunit